MKKKMKKIILQAKVPAPENKKKIIIINK